MKQTCTFVLVWSTLMSAIVGARGQDSPDLLRRYAEKLPIGSMVTVRIAGGERLTGVLMAVDYDGITVKPNTRVPEPARQIGFDRLAQLQLKQNGGESILKGIAIGAGVGGAAIVGILLAFAAAWD